MSEQETDTSPSEKAAATEKQEMSADRPQGDRSAPGCIAILLLIILLLVMFWPEPRTPPPSPFSGPPATATATFLPGTPSPIPPTNTPIPAPGTATYPCQAGIASGKTVNVVYEAVRMRLSPGYVEKDDKIDTKHYMQTGDKVVVKDGPQIKDGLCWWYIEHEGLQGWTADHSEQGRLLLSAGQ